MFVRVALVASLLIACGPHKVSNTDAGGGSDGPTTAPHTLIAIEIDPTNPIVQLDLNTPGSQPFTAHGIYADNVTDDLTSQVTWTVMNPAVGAMNGATLAVPAFAATGVAVSKITADFSGLTGEAQVTVVAYRQSGTQQDFFFVLPFQDPTGDQNKPLDFGTTIPSLDVFFDMDTTASMTGEIKNLQTALTGTIIPGIQGAVTDAQFGVGSMQDFPVSPYGNTSSLGQCGVGLDQPDQPFRLFQTITNSTTAIAAGVADLSVPGNGEPIGCGNDVPEAGLESIYQISTGEGLTGPSPTSVPANHTGVGGVAFRQGTMPVIVTISDADSHGDGETGSCGDTEAYATPVSTVAHTRQNVKDALGAICARFVGIAAVTTGENAACTPEAYFTDLATTTGARVPPAAWDVGTRPAGCAANQCCTAANGAGRAPDASGLCPMVFDVSTTGTGVSASVVTGIQMLTRFATFDVTSSTQGQTSDIDGNPLPMPHTTAEFLKAITPTAFTLPPPPPTLPTPTFDTTTFHTVTPGTIVSFTVGAFNDFVPATANAQIFKATIQVLAGGCTPLDQRDVLILVPPMPVVIDIAKN